MNKYTQLEDFVVADHITDMEITGSLANEAGLPVELDMFVNDERGRRFALNVMTFNRYCEVIGSPIHETGIEDPGAPHVFVINEDEISMDSLVELLKSPDMRVFKPYLLELDSEDSQE